MLQWWTECLWLLLRNRASWLLVWVVCPKLMLLWQHGTVCKRAGFVLGALWQILMLVALFIRNPTLGIQLAFSGWNSPVVLAQALSQYVRCMAVQENTIWISAGTSCREGPSAQGCCGYRAAAAWVFLFSWTCCASVSCISRQPCNTSTWNADTVHCFHCWTWCQSLTGTVLHNHFCPKSWPNEGVLLLAGVMKWGHSGEEEVSSSDRFMWKEVFFMARSLSLTYWRLLEVMLKCLHIKYKKMSSVLRNN